MVKRLFALCFFMFFFINSILCMAQNAIDDTNWVSGPSPNWYVNWDKALAQAQKSKKPIFVLNTGSDWCVWCKKLHSEVLSKAEFQKFATRKCVLVYLDSPNSSPMPKEQREHNKLLTQTLPMGKGVPHVLIVSSQGKKLGEIGGGGLTCEDFLKQLQGILKTKGEKIKDKKVQTLFTDGYAALQKKIIEIQKSLPKANKEDFKAVVTGLTVLDTKERYQATEKTYKKLKFQLPDKKVTVPFGKTVIFRVEYDFPKGYEARIWMRDSWPPGEIQKSFYFGSNPSELYRNKGTAYGFLCLLERGEACTLKTVAIRTSSEPELVDGPKEWEISRTDVNITFLKDIQEKNTDGKKNKKK